MKTPMGIWLHAGQRWIVLDRNHRRAVTVLGWNPVQSRVKIKTDGGSRFRWARLSRFNGKSGGYAPMPSGPEPDKPPTIVEIPTESGPGWDVDWKFLRDIALEADAPENIMWEEIEYVILALAKRGCVKLQGKPR